MIIDFKAERERLRQEVCEQETKDAIYNNQLDHAEAAVFIIGLGAILLVALKLF